MPAMTTVAKPTSWQTDLQHLVAAAQAGDAAALPALRRLLRDWPEIWHELADLSRRAEDALLDLAGPDQVLIKESIRLKLAELRDDLGAPSAPALEKLLIDRLSLCWLQVNLV